MSNTDYYKARYSSALVVVRDQAANLRRARNLIFALFVLLTLVSIALGATLAQTNFHQPKTLEIPNEHPL